MPPNSRACRSRAHRAERRLARGARRWRRARFRASMSFQWSVSTSSRSRSSGHDLAPMRTGTPEIEVLRVERHARVCLVSRCDHVWRRTPRRVDEPPSRGAVTRPGYREHLGSSRVSLTRSPRSQVQHCHGVVMRIVRRYSDGYGDGRRRRDADRLRARGRGPRRRHVRGHGRQNAARWSGRTCATAMHGVSQVEQCVRRIAKGTTRHASIRPVGRGPRRCYDARNAWGRSTV